MSPQIKETYVLRCQKGTTNFLSSKRRYNPYAFTEGGIITLAGLISKPLDFGGFKSTYFDQIKLVEIDHVNRLKSTYLK